MNIKNSIENYLFDKNYYISFFDNNVYLFNYIELNDFNCNHIIATFNTFQLLLKGNNLLIKRMGKNELLVSGTINKLEFTYV